METFKRYWVSVQVHQHKAWYCNCTQTHWHRTNELQRERLDFTGREMHSFFFGIPFMLHCKSIRLTFFCCGGEEEFRDCRHCWNLKHVYELCRVSATSQIQIRCYQRWNSPSSVWVTRIQFANEGTGETITRSTHHWQFSLWIICHSGKCRQYQPLFSHCVRCDLIL